MVTLVNETTQFKILVEEGMPEAQLRNVLRGFMADRTGSELDGIVQFRDTIPGCYGLLVELFEFCQIYPKYTTQYRQNELALARAQKEAAKKKERENAPHRLASQQNIALNKELRKILKGGH